MWTIDTRTCFTTTAIVLLCFGACKSNTSASQTDGSVDTSTSDDTNTGDGTSTETAVDSGGSDTNTGDASTGSECAPDNGTLNWQPLPVGIECGAGCRQLTFECR